jgi:hypothetical protein
MTDKVTLFGAAIMNITVWKSERAIKDDQSFTRLT